MRYRKRPWVVASLLGLAAIGALGVGALDFTLAVPSGPGVVALKTVGTKSLRSTGIILTRFTGAKAITEAEAIHTGVRTNRRLRVIEAVLADVTDPGLHFLRKPCWVLSMGPQHEIIVPNGDQPGDGRLDWQLDLVDAHTGRDTYSLGAGASYSSY